MEKAVSCGGVVIYRNKILLLYKNFRNRYEGWVLPKGKSEYTFNIPGDIVEKEVHWYLMSSNSFYSKPQREEYFYDSGYYKYIEAYHLLKFPNERMILKKAYKQYLELNKKKNKR